MKDITEDSIKACEACADLSPVFAAAARDLQSLKAAGFIIVEGPYIPVYFTKELKP